MNLDPKQLEERIRLILIEEIDGDDGGCSYGNAHERIHQIIRDVVEAVTPESMGVRDVSNIQRLLDAGYDSCLDEMKRKAEELGL